MSGDLGYVFVMTYGRSGSTLLMGLLNTIPGYLIRGENDDALRFLYDFHRTCVERSNFWPVERVRMRTDPFYGIGDFPPAASIAGTRRLAVETLLRPKADTRVTGFKEIRWWRHDDLDAYVAWLREVFPGARFLVNTRSHAAVLKSKWWAKGGDKSEHLADIERTPPGHRRPPRRRGVPRPLRRLRRRPHRPRPDVRLARRGVRRGVGQADHDQEALGLITRQVRRGHRVLQ